LYYKHPPPTKANKHTHTHTQNQKAITKGNQQDNKPTPTTRTKCSQKPTPTPNFHAKFLTLKIKHLTLYIILHIIIILCTHETSDDPHSKTIKTSFFRNKPPSPTPPHPQKNKNKKPLVREMTNDFWGRAI